MYWKVSRDILVYSWNLVGSFFNSQNRWWYSPNCRLSLFSGWTLCALVFFTDLNNKELSSSKNSSSDDIMLAIILCLDNTGLKTVWDRFNTSSLGPLACRAYLKGYQRLEAGKSAAENLLHYVRTLTQCVEERRVNFFFVMCALGKKCQGEL